MRIAAVLALIALVVMFAGPSTTPESSLSGGLVLGSAVHAGSLTVWPVLAADVPDIGPFRSLNEAQERGELGIHELESAEVGKLVLENRGDVPLLACAGAIFVGGKQDRQLGEDIVVAARSSVPVVTFCVEQDRWSGQRTFVVANANATRAVRAAGQYGGDQSNVWRGVARIRASIGLTDGSYRAVALARQDHAARVVAYLRSQAGNLVGYAYSVNGNVMGMRTFAHPALLTPRLDALIHAICVESAADDSQPNPDSEETQRMAIYLRLAADAHDDGDRDMAKRQAERALALDPDNANAQELVRLAKQHERADNPDRFNREWRTVMAQLETCALGTQAAVRVPNSWGDTGTDAHGLGGDPLAVLDDVTSGLDTGFIPPQITRVADYDIEISQTAASSVERVGLSAGGTGLAPTSGLFFNDGSPERSVETKGVNRNRYRKTPTGNRATCSIRSKDGRWIRLTRDWSARE